MLIVITSYSIHYTKLYEQSIFQGGYNAATNTPDLDVSPSNLIKKGWFWAVTDTGAFFAETVQPGDLIYANQDNPGATFANWVVVQSGQDIATAGASDGATVKGIAGFNSAHFNVTAVITSYSIHYTKLYEANVAPGLSWLAYIKSPG